MQVCTSSSKDIILALCWHDEISIYYFKLDMESKWTTVINIDENLLLRLHNGTTLEENM